MPASTRVKAPLGGTKSSSGNTPRGTLVFQAPPPPQWPEMINTGGDSSNHSKISLANILVKLNIKCIRVVQNFNKKRVRLVTRESKPGLLLNLPSLGATMPSSRVPPAVFVPSRGVQNQIDIGRGASRSVANTISFGILSVDACMQSDVTHVVTLAGVHVDFYAGYSCARIGPPFLKAN